MEEEGASLEYLPVELDVQEDQEEREVTAAERVRAAGQGDEECHGYWEQPELSALSTEDYDAFKLDGRTAKEIGDPMKVYPDAARTPMLMWAQFRDQHGEDAPDESEMLERVDPDVLGNHVGAKTNSEDEQDEFEDTKIDDLNLQDWLVRDRQVEDHPDEFGHERKCGVAGWAVKRRTDWFKTRALQEWDLS